MAKLAGYCTLAARGVPLVDLPEALTKRLPPIHRYLWRAEAEWLLPRHFKGRNLEGRCWQMQPRGPVKSEMAVVALFADAKDEATVAFYCHYGFQRFSE